MNFIINDFSIDCQFETVDEFMDSLVEYTLPMLQIIKDNDYSLYKTYHTFACKLFGDTTINSFIYSNDYNGYSEITYFKRMLQNLMKDPYWEEDTKTDSSAIYDCDATGQFSGSEPNCFSETLEREGFLVSLEHERFIKPSIPIKKNGIDYEINNGFNKDMFTKFLFLQEKIGFSEFLSSNKYPKQIAFYKVNKKYYADEPFEKGDLSKEDVISIQKDFYRAVEFISLGNLTSRYSDSITHGGLTYFEFRCSLSNNREFRIYYYEDNGTLVYFNSLIKKTSSLKKHVKDKTVELIKHYLNNKG